MTIKELIDRHGGIAEFRRKVEQQKKANTPSRQAMHCHYSGKYKAVHQWVREFYRAFGVTEF
jgi:hypothetical protein